LHYVDCALNLANQFEPTFFFFASGTWKMKRQSNTHLKYME